jgi:hypothetical protein
MNEAQESSLYPKVRKSNAPRRSEGGGSTRQRLRRRLHLGMDRQRRTTEDGLIKVDISSFKLYSKK